MEWWDPKKDQKQVDVIRLARSIGGSVLDAATGKGRFLMDLLDSKEGMFIVALDISKEMIRISRELTGNHGMGGQVSFVIGDVEHLPFRDSYFDVTLCIDTLVHLENPQIGLHELSRVTQNTVIVDVTSANPLRQLFDSKGLREKVKRFIGHVIVVGTRLLLGQRPFWKFYGSFLKHYTVPWSSYTKREFLNFVEGAGLRLRKLFRYGRQLAPSTYMAVCEKSSNLGRDARKSPGHQ